jgi:hypothetical protein
MPDRPLIAPKYEQTICPWTPENTRHDHQLIFPLSNNRLMHVWSEYYANRPSDPFRTQYDTERGTQDEFPCQLSGKISTDQGRTWSPKFILQENVWGKNVKHPNMIRLKN